MSDGDQRDPRIVYAENQRSTRTWREMNDQDLTKEDIAEMRQAGIAAQTIGAEIRTLRALLRDIVTDYGRVCDGGDCACSMAQARRLVAELTPGELRAKSGKVLTDADIEELAAEAEAGYDVDKIRRVRRDSDCEEARPHQQHEWIYAGLRRECSGRGAWTPPTDPDSDPVLRRRM